MKKNSLEKSISVLNDADIPRMLTRVTMQSKSPEGPLSQFINLHINTKTFEITKVDPKFIGDDGDMKNVHAEILSDIRTFEMTAIKVRDEEGLSDELRDASQNVLNTYLKRLVDAKK